ncbi:exodeoxyribonuclease VII large subunit [Verrucomicrobia bacterium IMCC26134]|jgi:exodeoxyribonuclease VII large subunit|nr:exodeoxyribonuclease VII large subunit [Verrucomicrobia bacterium IMCC26134]
MADFDFDLGNDGGTRAESVTDFTRRVKTLLESGLRPGWVRGEVSNLRIQTSGHVYFSLKDTGAQLAAVMFRGDAGRQTVKLRDGMQVVAYGEISVYEARGNYQLIVRVVVEDGVGRLQREFEALKARLAEEGLFAKERKRALPRLPRTVGFVTSPTGAAVQDFLRILSRRGWRGRVVVLPAKVQGDGAATEVAAMIALANDPAACGAVFDLLVVGRGGGSLEDLWAFNEEVLVRAVAGSRVPVISSVGHEIDFTLSDFAADVRAETPSAAAELISSGWVAESERLAQLGKALRAEAETALESARERVDGLAARLRLLSPMTQVERSWQRLDDIQARFTKAAAGAVQIRRHGVALTAGRFAAASPARRVERESQRLLGLWKRLQAASPASVLNRGFAIVRDEEGRAITRAAELRAGQRIEIELGDGRGAARVE